MRAVKERLGELRQLARQAASSALQQKVFAPVLAKIEAVVAAVEKDPELYSI